VNFPEVKLELGVEKPELGPLEYFGYKVPSSLEHPDRDVEGSHQQLALNVLVHIVEASYVRGAVAYH
jgi:hypothetical protein